MKFLLDTDTCIYAIKQNESVLKALLSKSRADVAVSAVTIWEICIKREIGKLDFAGSPTTACREAGFRLLDVTATHAELAGGLPRHHGDSFDRMLIAQAKLEGFVLATEDRQFSLYGVPILGTG